MFFVAADLRLPTSKFSRSRQRYFSPGIRATVIRPIDVLAGMQLGVTAAFWGWFAGSNVVLGPDDVFPCRVAPAPGGGGGSANDHWGSFSNFRAVVGYDIKRWFTLALSYDVWSQHPDSDGGRENPFYNENARLIFTLTFRADGLCASTRDKRAEAALSAAGVEEF